MAKFVSVFAALAFAASSISAVAANPVAQLTGAQGKVMVDTGHGFVAPEGLVELTAGDKVFVGPEGRASITYNEGCSVDVAEGSILSIAAQAPCKKGEVAALAGNTILTPVADLDVDAGVCDGAGVFACGAPALLPLLLLGGAVGLGVTTYVLTKDEDNAPVCTTC